MTKFTEDQATWVKRRIASATFPTDVDGINIQDWKKWNIELIKEKIPEEFHQYFTDQLDKLGKVTTPEIFNIGLDNLNKKINSSVTKDLADQRAEFNKLIGNYQTLIEDREIPMSAGQVFWEVFGDNFSHVFTKGIELTDELKSSLEACRIKAELGTLVATELEGIQSVIGGAAAHAAAPAHEVAGSSMDATRAAGGGAGSPASATAAPSPKPALHEREVTPEELGGSNYLITKTLDGKSGLVYYKCNLPEGEVVVNKEGHAFVSSATKAQDLVDALNTDSEGRFNIKQLIHNGKLMNLNTSLGVLLDENPSIVTNTPGFYIIPQGMKRTTEHEVAPGSTLAPTPVTIRPGERGHDGARR